MLTISLTCPFCHSTHSVDVNPEAYRNWERGELILRAMPTLSATQRDQLIFDMCPKCQDSIFGSDEVSFDPYCGHHTDGC